MLLLRVLKYKIIISHFGISVVFVSLLLSVSAHPSCVESNNDGVGPNGWQCGKCKFCVVCDLKVKDPVSIVSSDHFIIVLIYKNGVVSVCVFGTFYARGIFNRVTDI